MLDKKSVELYKCRRLPSDLRPTILERHRARTLREQRTRRMLRPAAALASLALCAALGTAWLLRPTDGITVSGRQIGSRPAVVEMCSTAYANGISRLALFPDETEPLRTAQSCISLPIREEDGVCIAVSGGMLLLPGTDGTPVFADRSGWAEDGAEVLWALDGCEDASPLTAEISRRDGTLLHRLRVTYDSARGEWLASLENP